MSFTQNPQVSRRLALLLSLFFGLQAAMFAHDFPVLRIVQAGAEKKLALSIEGIQGEARLSLRDAAGHVLLSEDISHSAYRKLYNLAQLPAGHYVLTLSTSRQEVAQPLQVTANQVIFNPADRIEIFAPVVNIQERLLDVTLLTVRPGLVSLTLRDNQDEEVYALQQEADDKFERRFNLRHLPAGSYQLSISYLGRVWQQTLTIK